jgi:DNA polymerase III delta prime subunit
MERFNTGVELNEGYAKAVDRTAELERLASRVRQRKHLLIFGPEGVGKTRLLQEFARTEALALYVSQTKSPHDLLLSLSESLRTKLGVGSLPSNTSSMSTSGLKATVDKALNAKPFLLMVDHLQGPSRVVAKIVKELGYHGRTPIFLGARSPHMEDVGALQALCYDKSERLEMTNWSSEIAREFAYREAERTDLWASNLDTALQSIVQLSGGNPGSILGMLKMAARPQYRIDDQIKFHVLYLDYRMGRR